MLDFYKEEDGYRIYYIEGKRVGKNFELIKYLMNKNGISPSKARKILNKMKEYNDDTKKV